MIANQANGTLPVWMIALCDQVDLQTTSIDSVDPEPPKKAPDEMSDKQLRRWKLWKKAKSRCYYCGSKTEFKRSTIDHVHPRSKGGADDESNIVLCCYRCNAEKNDLTLEEFLRLLHSKYRSLKDRSANDFPDQIHSGQC